MMKRIFIETGSKKSNEYVFVKTLCKQIGIGEYEIQAVGGKDNLSVRIADLEDEGYQNLILFDADKDFEQSKQHIEDQLNGIAARIFLFPNNRDEGRFETLLEQIAVDRTPLVCFKQYEDCLGSGCGYTLPDLKAKMYSYINVKGFYENKIKDGDWGFGNKQYWNLDHEYIQLLTTFLTQ